MQMGKKKNNKSANASQQQNEKTQLHAELHKLNSIYAEQTITDPCIPSPVQMHQNS